MSDYKKGLTAAIITAVAWSFLAILLKIALNHSDAYTIVWYRMAVAGAVMLCYLGFTNHRKLIEIKNIPPMGWFCALCLGLNYIGYMKCVELTSPANTQVFIQLAPLMLALSGVVFFNETLVKKQWLGFLITILGYGFFLYDRSNNFFDFGWNYFIGQLWIIMAALGWVIFAVIQKILLKKWDASQLNTLVYVGSALMVTPLADFQGLGSIDLSIHFLFFILGLNTILAYGCLSIALKHLPASHVSPILIGNPIITLLLLLVIETLSLKWFPPDNVQHWGYIGAGLVVLGISLVVTAKKS